MKRTRSRLWLKGRAAQLSVRLEGLCERWAGQVSETNETVPVRVRGRYRKKSIAVITRGTTMDGL